MGRLTNRLYEFGPFRIDPVERVLLRGGRPVRLKPKVVDLLLVLVQNSGRILEKDRLMRELWPDTFVEEGNLTVSIFALRKALGEGRDGHPYVETVPRRGYRFVADVREVCDQTGAAREEGYRATSAGGGGEAGACGGVKSVAVLPFKTIGREALAESYLGLGMADALITRLSNVRQITVRPTSAVRAYALKHDPVEAGRELRVGFVLDGSLQRVGKRIRVTVQLLSVGKGALLWAEKFDEKFTSIFSVEDSISEQVAGALIRKLSGEERGRLKKHHTENAEAYQAYLKGRFFWGQKTPEGFERGIGYFSQAIEADPGYALAYAGLADSYMSLGAYNILPLRSATPRALEAALKAQELDDDLAEVHTSLALLKMLNWDWPGAEKEFQRAIGLNPNCARVHDRYAIYLRNVGCVEKAVAEVRRAQELDPLSPVINADAGLLFCFARQYDRAIEQLRKTLELSPGFVVAHVYLGMAYEQKGMYEKAAAEYQYAARLLEDNPEFTAYLGRVYAVSGRRGEAHKVIGEVEEMSKRHYISPYYIALIYAGLGEEDQAFRWLEKAYEERDHELGLLKADQRLDGLRQNPRFADLERRVGLSPPPRKYRSGRSTLGRARRTG